MKKILFFTCSPQPLEVLRFFERVADRLRATGFTASALTADAPLSFVARRRGWRALYLNLDRPGARPEGYFTDPEIDDIYAMADAGPARADRKRRADRADRLAREVERHLTGAGVTGIVMWNGYLPLQRVVCAMAARRKLPVLFMENGYFPQTVQVGMGGVNADNEWLVRLEQEAFWDEVSARMAPLGDRRGAPEKLSWIEYPVRVGHMLARRTRRYRLAHPEEVVVNSWRQILGSRLVAWSRTLAGSLPWTIEKRETVPQEYYFVPFQVHDDSQVRFHSPWIRNMEQLLETVRRALGRRIPGARIVVKEHPVDQGRVDYRALRTKYPQVLFIRRIPAADLVKYCRAVITINSTVGFEGLLAGKPVITLGNAFYNRPGITLHAETEAELEELLAQGCISPRPEMLAAYLARVRKRFIPCAWRDADASGVGNMAEFVAAYFRR